MNKVYVLVGEYYDNECGCFVSDLFHGVYGTYEKAQEMKEVMDLHNEEAGFDDYLIEIREVEVL